MSRIDVANQGRRLELQTVREVYHNGDYTFPQRVMYEQLRRVPALMQPEQHEPAVRPRVEVDEMELILGPNPPTI